MNDTITERSYTVCLPELVIRHIRIVPIDNKDQALIKVLGSVAECVAARDACQLPYPRRRALDAFSGPLAGTRFWRTAIGDGNRVRQKDVLVCLCCGFTSLWSVILSDNGMILSGQKCHQQYCYCHARSPLPLSGEPLPYLDAHR
jgi:hypothetical protein